MHHYLTLVAPGADMVAAAPGARMVEVAAPGAEMAATHPKEVAAAQFLLASYANQASQSERCPERRKLAPSFQNRPKHQNQAQDGAST